MKTVQSVYGVFDTDLGRLVGLAPQGVSDVTFLAGQDTQTEGAPLTSASGALLSRTATDGAVEIVLPDGNPIFVISPDAPNDADGRPDGVIYIQTAA